MVTRDIYYKVGRKLEEKDFVIRKAEEQKEILEEELKHYIYEKIVYEDIKNSREDDSLIEERSIYKLLEIMKKQISPDEQEKVFSNLTHFILKVASDLQSYSICWLLETDEMLIDSPIVKFNEEGLWDSIVTHEKTDHLRTFSLVYDIVKNRFIEERKSVKRFVKNKRKEEFIYEKF